MLKHGLSIHGVLFIPTKERGAVPDSAWWILKTELSNRSQQRKDKSHTSPHLWDAHL